MGRRWETSETAMAAAAARCVGTVASAAATETWDRVRMLPRLIPIGPEELADESPAGRLVVVRRLAGALRGERTRGRAGHWSYSLDRHIALARALAAESRDLAGADRGRHTAPRLTDVR